MSKMEQFSKNGKFLLGDTPFLCDFVFGSWLLDVVDNKLAFARDEHAKVLEDYPWLKTYLANVRELNKKWLAKRMDAPL